MGARVTALVLALIAAGAVHSQVYRCKTPSGGTEYSQTPCGKDAQLLQDKRDSIDTSNAPSPLDALREKEQANQAFNRAYNGPRNTASPTSRTRQIDHAACTKADRDVRLEKMHARNDKEEQRRKQKIADWECGRFIPDDPASEPWRPTVLAAPPAPPPVITNCDAAGCWDSSAGRYTRAGSTDTYIAPNGKACTRSGGALICP